MAKRVDETTVRISTATAFRLHQFISTLLRSRLADFKAGKGAYPHRVTANEAIAVLLDRQESHSARSARSNAKRKQADVDNVDNVDTGEE